ncbi:hypothetical protein [Aquimarina algicola]|uniref:Uncharacterized protein n=1 Tax=Aquimarina algicola TaxID=2589995 RepID=A0A504J885_9FLAO|nr:hypothetical protein [Aquimarina algicola]TPN82391.1 hypothetical protein FHK87_23510 [Aquimarina algicola]
MNLEIIKSNLTQNGIFFTNDEILKQPTVIGYEKKFKWSWMATQLNTFIVATDFEDDPITVNEIDFHLTHAFKYAEKNYKGWPRGIQSGLGVISILLSTQIDAQAKEYCIKLKSGKKWAGFTIPVCINTSTNEVFAFDKNPIWGRIYYPHFKKLIKTTIQQ